MDLISIIVPVYNIEKYLERCINSIINQTYKSIEIIIVDDGSTDGSGILCEEFAHKDSRIKVLHTMHLGTSNARNCGLREAKGSYIGFVDGDDYIAENMYEKLIENMKENVDIVCCGRRCMNPSGMKNTNFFCLNTVKKFSNREAIQELLLLRSISFSVCTKLFRKELFDGIVFPYKKTCEDLPVAYALIKKSSNIIHIGEAKYFNCYRADSTSRKGFFKGQITAVLFARDILYDININYPEFKKEAEARYVKNALVTIKCINSSKNASTFEEMQKRIQKSLRRMIIRELTNPYIPKVYKKILLKNVIFSMNAKDYEEI
ncbi:MAG: glycosyltransferase [Lachnospiraceae bacterium]|nr:glycosyltransferase [Lachnospiraceae bacterium]